MTTPDPRPFFLNLLQIRLPATAMASVIHRLTGVLLFVALPFAVYLLQHSLRDAAGYAAAAAVIAAWPLRLLLALLGWALLHHLLAGLRVLMIDMDIGVTRSTARYSALAVTWLAAAAFIVLAVWL